jgi:DNA-binding MarR family transcriptional regulator
MFAANNKEFQMSRSATSAATITRALIELASLMEDYGGFRGRKFDSRMVALAIETLIATRAGKRLKASDLSKQLQIPRQTVTRHLKPLAKVAKANRQEYLVDLADGNRPLSSQKLRDAFRAMTTAIA